MILRVEDLEKRAAAGVLERMLSDLRWLGLDWDEGPVWQEKEESDFLADRSVIQIESGPTAPYTQSRRGGFYRAIFERLQRSGYIYPCVCTRKDILSVLSAPHEGEQGPAYPGTCRDRFGSYEEALAACPVGRKPIWRFRADSAPVVFDDLFFGRQSVDVAGMFGDFTVFKSPEEPAYQLGVAADDIAMGVTEVVRGDDLIPSTGCQILIYQALGAVLPSYGHVPLVVGPDGKRLAKRHGDFRIASLRESGVSPEEIVGRLAGWSGLGSGEARRAAEFIGIWDWKAREKRRIVLDGSGQGTPAG